MSRHHAGRLVAAIGAVLLLTAAEIPANRRAINEAQGFLTSACDGNSDTHEVEACREFQMIFVFDYLRAMAGETLSMKNMAFYFSNPRGNINEQSKVRSCEWAMLAQMSGKTPEDGSTLDGLVDNYCQNISPNDLYAAKVYASTAAARIASSPARIPTGGDGDDWPGIDCDTLVVRYLAQGRFAPPRCRPSHGPLDSSVAPLVP